MKRVSHNLRNGKLTVETVPDPMVQPGHVLIANRYSVISAGTEKSARRLAQKSLLAKARERPDQVRRVLEKVGTEGLLNTIRQVQARLDQPAGLGYCAAGVVLACGAGVQEFKPGDAVASNGHHAEVVCVARHLCARVPEGVPLDQAAFAVLGAIALQGIRLSKLALGETALVIGLGLVGQITVSLLKAAGVRVIGTDLDAAKCELAGKMGAWLARPGLRAEDVISLTGGLGADAVLIAASTESDGPVTLAGEAVRPKGRVVAVGAVGMNLPRRPYYFKEAEFVVSCSYGAGRYDTRYEEGGQDYPAPFVRWTAQRNMQAVLDQLAAGQVQFAPLISHRFDIDAAPQAYELIESGHEPYLGILLEYPQRAPGRTQRRLELRPRRGTSGTVGIGCIGAGDFARSVLLPKLCSLAAVRAEIICSAGGASAAHIGRKLGFAAATSDVREVFDHPGVDAVFIATRHDTHAALAIEALRAGKHVFVEKPLCLTLEELVEVESALADCAGEPRLLTVGFNRRFSSAARAVRQFMSRQAERQGESVVPPLAVAIRFNAGSVPTDHWTQQEQIGGGRLVGEACHAIDLATYLAGSPPVRVFAESVGGRQASEITDDHCFITLRHANGEVSSVAYLAGGDRAFSKERIEVVGGSAVAVIDDFLSAYGWRAGQRQKLWRGARDKGHDQQLSRFVESIVRGEAAPIRWSDLRATTLASILAVRSLREGRPLAIPETLLPQQSHDSAVREAG